MFLSRNFVTKFRGQVLYCRRTYVVWQSFEKICAETAEKVFGDKKLDVNYVANADGDRN